MIVAAVLVDDPAWDGLVSGLTAAVERTLAVAGEHVLPPPTEAAVSVALMNDEQVRRLNRHYRGQDKATNVLSFPALEADALADVKAGRRPAGLPRGAEIELGDIALARETVIAEARRQGKTADHHLRHLVVHGFLHLLGYDHQAEDEAALMEDTEVRILADLGINDPYRANHETSDR